MYTSVDGEKIEFVADGETLFLLHGGKRLPVEVATGDYYVAHPDFELFPFYFERLKNGPAMSVGHGARWWASDRFDGPRTFEVPESWRAFAGHYRNEDPWLGSLRVVVRQGKLWVNGTAALRQTAPGMFRFAEPDYNPEWLEFREVVNGKAQHVRLSGSDLWRVLAR